MAGEKDKYVFTLDDACLEKAKTELNEDEKNRDGAVETFKTWILQQKWLNTPTDYPFLLRFLRTKKFSQLEARKTLENFWAKRTQLKGWYAKKNIWDPKIIEMLKSGFILRLPQPDKQGRIWIMDRPGCLNADKVVDFYGVDSYFKSISLVLDWVMTDERAQINGIVWFADLSGMTMKHNISVYNTGGVKNFIELVQGVYPIRVNAIQLYGCPPILEISAQAAVAFMKKKIRDRVNFQKTLASMYKTIDKDVLPDEYLPDNYKGNTGPVSGVIDYMIKELTSDPVVQYIDRLANGEHGVDLKQKPVDLPSESFRKLSTD